MEPIPSEFQKMVEELQNFFKRQSLPEANPARSARTPPELRRKRVPKFFF
jgi:hypothetical protein